MTHLTPFTIINIPAGQRQPILISIPHAGTWIPPEDRRFMLEAIQDHPPDTDWFVDRLYDFAPSLGVGCIRANLSRYIIDLNRPSDGKALYQDSRSNTGLIPRQTFAGGPIYSDVADLARLKSKRLSLYYEPYYEAIARLLEERRQEFGYCLLIDAHSIKRRVPSIKPEPFPDIIISDNDGKSCHPALIAAAKSGLGDSYDVRVNEIFKGGHITRTFGQVSKAVYAMQIEMSQDLYLDESTDTLIDEHLRLKSQLSLMIEQLINTIKTL